jgi:hypothetical protein
VFDVLADQARFEAVQIGERGRTLIWSDDAGDEIDLCADGRVSAASAPGPFRHPDRTSLQ